MVDPDYFSRQCTEIDDSRPSLIIKFGVTKDLSSQDSDFSVTTPVPFAEDIANRTLALHESLIEAALQDAVRDCKFCAAGSLFKTTFFEPTGNGSYFKNHNQLSKQ